MLILNKNLDYIVLDLDENNVVNNEASVMVDKLLQSKCFVKGKLPKCKIALSRIIRRADSKVATRFVDDVITQLKDIQDDVIGNEDIIRKDIGKKSFHLNQHGLKRFAVNLIAGSREL